MVTMVWSTDRKPQAKSSENTPWSQQEPLLSETVTLTKADLKALLEAVSNNSSPSTTSNHVTGFPDYGNEDFNQGKSMYHQNNEDGNESGYPPSPELSISHPHSSDLRGTLSSYLDNRITSDNQTDQSNGNMKSKLSKIEMKKKQWEKEREETSHWYPWGKPGAGAPSAILQRTVNTCAGESNRATPQLNSIRYPENPSDRGYSGYSSVMTSYTRKPMQDFLKSSLPFGPQLENGGDLSKKEKDAEWRRQLDKQRDEKRQSKQKGRRSEGWGSSTPDPDSPSPFLQIGNQSLSYARGQNVLIDPETLSKKIETRQKQLEYQQFVKAQMEEKKFRQQEEKERKKQEEAEEEKRLEEDRLKLKELYEREQMQIRLKEAQDQRAREKLIAAHKDAAVLAEAERKAKKAEKRQVSVDSGGMMPLRQRSVQETLVEEPKESNPAVPVPTLETFIEKPKEFPKVQQTATVHPLPSPAHLKVLGREFGVQTDPSWSPYITNRLLTPSQWRTRERQPGSSSKEVQNGSWNGSDNLREVASQTEMKQLHYPGRFVSKIEDSSSSSSCSSADTRSPRQLLIKAKLESPRINQSLQVNKAEKFDPESIHRPKWGVNRPTKNYVKMTERDPNSDRRRKLQDMRKQHWDRELATQRALTQTKKFLNVPQSRDRVKRVVETPSSISERDSRMTNRDWLVDQPGLLSRTYSLHNGHKVYAPPSSREDSATSRDSASAYLPPLNGCWSHSTDSLMPSGEDEEGNTGSLSNVLSKDINQLLIEEFQPVRRKWRSQENFSRNMPRDSANSSVKSKMLQNITNQSHMRISDDSLAPSQRRKWSDQDNFDLEKVSILRTIASQGGYTEAESSRETSAVGDKRASDEHIGEVICTNETDHLVDAVAIDKKPTLRQDKILQQLSTLRQGLLLKQKEIENLLLKLPDTN